MIEIIDGETWGLHTQIEIKALNTGTLIIHTKPHNYPHAYYTPPHYYHYDTDLRFIQLYMGNRPHTMPLRSRHPYSI